MLAPNRPVATMRSHGPLSGDAEMPAVATRPIALIATSKACELRTRSASAPHNSRAPVPTKPITASMPPAVVSAIPTSSTANTLTKPRTAPIPQPIAVALTVRTLMRRPFGSLRLPRSRGTIDAAGCTPDSHISPRPITGRPTPVATAHSQPQASATGGITTPARAIPNGPPDCLIPTVSPCSLVGTWAPISVLVAGLAAEAVSPAIIARATSTATTGAKAIPSEVPTAT